MYLVMITNILIPEKMQVSCGRMRELQIRSHDPVLFASTALVQDTQAFVSKTEVGRWARRVADGKSTGVSPLSDIPGVQEAKIPFMLPAHFPIANSDMAKVTTTPY